MTENRRYFVITPFYQLEIARWELTPRLLDAESEKRRGFNIGGLAIVDDTGQVFFRILPRRKRKTTR